MLVEVNTVAGLRRVAEVCDEHLELVYFPTSIRGQLTNRFPESPIRVFCYPSEEYAQYYFMVKDNVHIKPYCMLAHVPETKFDRHSFLDCLREFRLRALGALDSNRPHLVIGREELVKLYTLLMSNIVCDVVPANLSLNLFYMDSEQRKEALGASPSLPAGYSFSELDADEEADVVNSTWQHAKEGDLEQTHAKLRRMPSACVRFGPRPVAFEMVDPAGFLNNQYVYEEHRRKGLGTAVELRLAQKMIKRGMVPFKTVDKRNTVALRLSQQSPFWTQWTEDDGKAAGVVFQEWSLTQ